MRAFASVVVLIAFRLALSSAASARDAAAPANDPALQMIAPKVDPGSAYRLSERKFQGIPGVARAPGGRLWATWYGGGDDEGPDNYVMLVTSGDDGKTWSEFKLVIDPAGLLRTFDPGLWIDPQGKLWWFYMQSYGFWDGRAGVWAMTTENPDAAIPRWSAPRRLADGIMMNKPTVLENGAWLFPISIWDQMPARDLSATDRKHVPNEQNKWNPATVGAHVYRSDDRGGTLRKVATVRTAEPSPDEHMFVERRDGSLWMLIRDRGGMAESISKDGGKTWSAPKPATIPHAVSRFFIRRLRSGNLLLVKHNSPTVDSAWMQGQATPKAKQPRSHLTAYVSRDDGKTWQGGLSLDERNGVSYPDGDQAEDGRLFVIYDRNRKAEREVLMARFTEADVAAGKLVDARSALRILVYRASESK